MERLKTLNIYQKAVISITIIIMIGFSLLYPKIISKVGFEFKNEILVPKTEGNNVAYSGKIDGKNAVFEVLDNKTVTYKWHDKVYGPFTMEEDSSAIPKEHEYKSSMKGIELRENNNIIFRGGIFEHKNKLYAYNQDGTADESCAYELSDVELKQDDPTKPTIYTILKLMNNPKLTHKGEWIGLIFGILVSIFSIIVVLFYDEIYRFQSNLQTRTETVENKDATSTETLTKYASWVVFPILALVIFIFGIR